MFKRPQLTELDRMPDSITYKVSPPLGNEELRILFGAAWGTPTDADFEPVLAHSLACIAAYHGPELVGFVNLAWDGGIHAFLLDTSVHPQWQRRGIGTRLVQEAGRVAAERGIHWLHVDYEPHLEQFYRACGFEPTLAGLRRLRDPSR
jgi:GNAT superfamily N-acetyltransferase